MNLCVRRGEAAPVAFWIRLLLSAMLEGPKAACLSSGSGFLRAGRPFPHPRLLGRSPSPHHCATGTLDLAPRGQELNLCIWRRKEAPVVIWLRVLPSIMPVGRKAAFVSSDYYFRKS